MVLFVNIFTHYTAIVLYYQKKKAPKRFFRLCNNYRASMKTHDIPENAEMRINDDNCCSEINLKDGFFQVFIILLLFFRIYFYSFT